MTRYGLFGGTFDPIHQGHLHFAASASNALNLEKVFFAPAAQNPLKTESAGATADQRLEMVRLALQDSELPAFGVYDGELRRPGPSYTLDTLVDLQAQHPQVEWHVLMGSEVFATLPRWRFPEKILERARLLVVTRPGQPAPDRAAVLADLASPQSIKRIRMLEIDPLPFSATTIRAGLRRLTPEQRAASCSPVPGLHRAVWLFIQKNRLYT